MDITNTNEMPEVFPETNESAEVLQGVVGTNVKINKYVLFGINTLVMLPTIIVDYSTTGMIAFLAATLFTFIITLKSSDEIPAVADLPLMLLADAVTYLGVYFFDQFSGEVWGELRPFSQSIGGIFWLVLLVGAVIGFIALKYKKIIWLTGISGGFIGAAFIILGWGYILGWDYGSFRHFRFAGFGAALLLLFGLADMLWTALLYLIAKTVPKKAKRTVAVGVILLSLFIITLFSGAEVIGDNSWRWGRAILDSPNTAFAWWKVIISTVVLLAGAFMLYVKDAGKTDHLSIDAYFLIITAEIVLMTRILMSVYFSLNILVLVIVVIGSLRCMKNDYMGKKTLRQDSGTYLATQFIAAVVLMILLKNGLWLNVLLSAAFLGVFYAEKGAQQNRRHPVIHWIAVLVCIVFEAAALMARKGFSADVLMMLALVLGAGLLTMFAINMKQPGGRRAPDALKIIVCVCVGIICLAVIPRSAVRINTVMDEGNQKVTIHLEAKGKKNTVQNAYCYWKDIFERKSDATKVILKADGVSDEAEWSRVLIWDDSVSPDEEGWPATVTAVTPEDDDLSGDKWIASVWEEMLVIVAEDAHGVTSSKVVWYPYWLHIVFDGG